MTSEATTLLLKPVEIPALPPNIAVPEGGLSLGRDPANLVTLDADQFPHVSSCHARVTLEDGRLFVEDLGSKNGTLVNGTEVKRSALKAGDVLQLGRKVGPRFILVSGTRLDATLCAQWIPSTLPRRGFDSSSSGPPSWQWCRSFRSPTGVPMTRCGSCPIRRRIFRLTVRAGEVEISFQTCF